MVSEKELGAERAACGVTEPDEDAAVFDTTMISTWLIVIVLRRYWNGKRSWPRLICMLALAAVPLADAGECRNLYHSVGYSCRKLK